MDSYGVHSSHVTNKGKVESRFATRRKDDLVKQVKKLLEEEICKQKTFNEKEKIMDIIELGTGDKRVLDATLELTETEGLEIEKLLTKIGKHVRKERAISNYTIHHGIKNLTNLGFLDRKEISEYGKLKPKVIFEVMRDKISSTQIQIAKQHTTKKVVANISQKAEITSKEDFLSLIQKAQTRLEQKKQELESKLKAIAGLEEEINQLTKTIGTAKDSYKKLKALLC